MKRILNINTQFEIIWWMERYIEQFYNSFSNMYDVYVLSIMKNNEKINIPSEKVFSLNEKIDNSTIWKINKLFFRSKNIANLCNNNRIDISISHWDISNLFNIISKFFWNKSNITIVIHNALSKDLLWTPLYILCKFTYKYADNIITVSKELSEDIKKQINKDNVKTIYNPFDFQKIELIKNEKIENKIDILLNNWKINFCNVARLASYKKQDKIIDFFYEYYKINNNIQLFFIWDWEKKYKDKLIEKINEYSLNNVIYFLWYQENVYKYIKYMNYYIYLSWLQEWFWRWLIDSLSCWVPILTHDYKYWAKEIIRNNEDFSICKKIEIHENGILTPYMNKEKYIEAMDKLSKTKFDKNKILKNIEKYDTENFKNEWNKILK